MTRVCTSCIMGSLGDTYDKHLQDTEKGQDEIVALPAWREGASTAGLQGRTNPGNRQIQRPAHHEGREELESDITGRPQDTWIAFPRDRQDKKWETLADADAVVAVTVDNPDDPKFAQIHMIDGNEMRERFDRAYRARIAAGHQIPLGRGIWVSLYREEASDPVVNVGAGAGLTNPPIARSPLELGADDLRPEADNDDATEGLGRSRTQNGPSSVNRQDETPLTIAEAKRRLALHLG